MFRSLDARGELLIFSGHAGAVAQLGERLNGIQEVVSSILSSSTINKPSGNRGFIVFTLFLQGL